MSLLKVEKVICFSFIFWLILSFFSSLIVLGLRQQTLPSLVVFTDVEQTNLFQRERGGVRRIVGRSLSKEVSNNRADNKS